MQFLLGIHHPDWLERTDVPSMVSYRSLYRRKKLPRALGPWAQDSGGFTELSMHGRYMTSARVYAQKTRRHADQIGNMDWAAIQDHMCEDLVLGRTGKSVRDHQRLTCLSYLDLRALEPDLPWLPVLQGREADDYRRHADMYASYGVDLTRQPLVGLGTVCRRQHTMVAVRLIQELAQLGIPLHGFGLKITSLLKLRSELAGADSMAWSLDGRLPHGGRCAKVRDHAVCANCIDYALLWRKRLVDRLGQGQLWDAVAA